jgi:PTS system mannose-specific IID component
VFNNDLGKVEFNLQTGVFDALLPGLLPLLVVLGVWAMLKKRAKPLTIVAAIFVLGFVLVGIKALCGAY